MEAILQVTGAKRADAHVLANVVEALRKKGGQAPLSSLTRNPLRLQGIVKTHARLLELRLGRSGSLSSARLRYFPGKYLAGTPLQAVEL